MGRIIRNLRAFARQESAPLDDVDVIKVINSVLEMVAGRADNARVNVTWHAPDAPVLVRAGDVRLSQVILNLVSNGIDAMQASETRELVIAVQVRDEMTRISVSDTGPGIDEPERIFDPFYSTKEVGEAEGMGLGLSISYGLVQSFGGDIKGRNREAGGAEFTIHLPSVSPERPL